MGRTYYAILGVPQDETQGGIRAAYHDLAKRLHPDHAGPGDETAIRELNQAYEVLSDPGRRRRYNHQLEGEREPRAARAEPLLRRRPRPEPLVPEPMSVLDDFHTVRPSVEALFDRFLRNFSGVGVPKGERPQALTVQVELTLEQATQGVEVPIGVPVFERCPRCGGTGEDWLFPCMGCNQEGYVERQRVVRLRVPGGVRHGEVFEVPLEALGIANLYLRLQVLIAA